MNTRALAVTLFYVSNAALLVHLAGGLLGWPGWAIFVISSAASISIGLWNGLHDLRIWGVE